MLIEHGAQVLTTRNWIFRTWSWCSAPKWVPILQMTCRPQNSCFCAFCWPFTTLKFSLAHCAPSPSPILALLLSLAHCRLVVPIQVFKQVASLYFSLSCEVLICWLSVTPLSPIHTGTFLLARKVTYTCPKPSFKTWGAHTLHSYVHHSKSLGGPLISMTNLDLSFMLGTLPRANTFLTVVLNALSKRPLTCLQCASMCLIPRLQHTPNMHWHFTQFASIKVSIWSPTYNAQPNGSAPKCSFNSWNSWNLQHCLTRHTTLINIVIDLQHKGCDKVFIQQLLRFCRLLCMWVVMVWARDVGQQIAFWSADKVVKLVKALG